MTSADVETHTGGARDAGSRALYRWAAVLLVGHIVILFAGFTMLAIVFEFPEVLRYPAEQRLALFRANEAVIVPTYWALAMTGFTQVLLTVLVAESLKPYRSTLLTVSVVFGILTGFGQAMGFGRWAVLIPYLAEQMADGGLEESARTTLALLEGAFNRYAGMLVGEHLSNIALGIWLLTLGLAARASGLLDRRLATVTALLSPIAWVLAAEQLGFGGATLELVTDFAFPLLAIIHSGFAWQLIRKEPGKPAPDLGVGFLVFAAVLYAAMVAPALAG